MKNTLKKVVSLMLVVCIVTISCVFVSCESSSESTMYERKQSNKSTTVKSNIKVRGNNKDNGHTTRSY